MAAPPVDRVVLDSYLQLIYPVPGPNAPANAPPGWTPNMRNRILNYAIPDFAAARAIATQELLDSPCSDSGLSW